MSAVDDYTKMWVDDPPETREAASVVAYADAAIAELEAEKAVATDEVRAIDATLARRPALADITDRLAKIERACSMAGRAEQAEAALNTQWEADKRLAVGLEQAEAQRDLCHASAADWHGQALLLQDELAALKERRCETCLRAYTDCTRLVLTTDASNIDIEYCSDWEARP